MAVTAINIYQDNTVGDSNLIPIHSPAIFLVDVSFTGTAPTQILVDIIDENATILDTASLIVFGDRSAILRTFAFIASGDGNSSGSIIRSLMGSFDDVLQLSDVLEYVEDITLNLTLKFYDPDDHAVYDEVNVTFIHGVAQFGNYPNLSEIFTNQDNVYYASENGYVYLYFYNSDITNDLSILEPSFNEVIALDFDDTEFSDYDDNLFSILI